MRKMYFIALLTTLVMEGCTPYTLDETSTDNGKQEETEKPMDNGQLSLSIRSNNDATINYPVSVYVFDKENCVYQTEIQDNDENFKVQLPQGNYNLTAFSGLNTTDYEVPEECTYESFLRLKNTYLASVPLMGVKKETELKKSSQLTLTLKHIMTSVSVTLQGIPKEAKAVALRVSPVSSGYSFSGNYQNDKKVCNISCQKNDTLWTATPVYFLPSESSSTSLSIQVTTNEGSESRSYSIPYQLEASQPYHLKGNYAGNKFTLEGKFAVEGWKPNKEIEFGFSDENSDDDTPPISNEGTVIVSRLPNEGDIWNGCYVWNVEELSDTESRFIAISPEEAEGLASDAIAYLASYEYNGWKNWTVLTKEQATAFRDEIGGKNFESLDSFNEQLAAAGLAPFSKVSGERYLCENCTYTFCFYNKIVSRVGAKTEYVIRPVKTIRAVLKK